MKITSRESFRELSLRCYENAKHLLDDALTLKEKGSYPRSYALTVLGYEEWSKSIVAYYLFTGLLEVNDQGLKEGFRFHNWKHLFGTLTVNVFLVFILYEESEIKEQYAGLNKSFYEGRVSFEEYGDRFNEILENDPSGVAITYRSFTEAFGKLLEDKHLIDKRKQAALYVDYDFNKKVISVPDDEFSKESLEESFKTYQLFIDSTSELMEELGKDDYIDRFKETIDDSVEYRKFIENYISFDE